MTAQFTPKGDKPEWRMVYDDLLDEALFGAVITYAELDECLGRDFRTNRAPLYRACTELGEQRKRWLEPVPSIGYRVTEPGDHVRISAGHKRKSRRQLGVAIRVLDATDLSRLTAEALSRWDSQQKTTFTLWAVFAHESRIRKIEEVLRKAGLV
ncbi:MAG: hypothetical protein V1912_11400 [bacterium]